MSKYSKFSSGGGKSKRVDDELDAWDYADEHAYNEQYEEECVKQNKTIQKAAPKKQQKPAATPQKKPATVDPKPKKQEAQEPLFEKAVALEPEPVLETYDNWEDAMDALEKHETQEEEKRAASRTQSK